MKTATQIATEASKVLLPGTFHIVTMRRDFAEIRVLRRAGGMRTVAVHGQESVAQVRQLVLTAYGK